jgi:DNA-binding CsgD family transcriptional regulator
MVFFDLERTLSISDCLPHEDFCRPQFAREWVVPQGFIDVAFSNVEKSATGCSIFTVMRDITDGPADDEFCRRFGLIYGAVAAMFVRKAALDLPSPPVAIAQQFQLTPAELRVLFSIVEIGGVSEVADVLGISEATVRTHLHRLFEKTGTGRQADLVKLVAGYCAAP